MRIYFFKLCWKNVWRNRRRTLITVNAIGIGVMALVGIHNYYDAFHEQVIQNVIRYHSGHLLVTAPGYQAQSAPSKFVKAPGRVMKWLKNHPEVKAASPRVIIQGLLSSPQGSANVLFTGIDPDQERRVTQFSRNIVQGTYLKKAKGTGIVIGRRLARLMKLKTGMKVVALTQGIDGSIGNELFFVEGIFETHSELDKSVAFIRLDPARRLVGLPPHGVHQVAVVLKNESALPEIQKDFQDQFKGRGVEILSWMQIQRPLMAMIELNKSANRLLMIIILFVAAMGIANSILMSIMERTREFGVMLAIGTSKTDVIKMVVVETLLLSAAGVFLGNLLGIGLTLYFQKNGFDLRWLTNQQIVVQGAIVQTITYPAVHLRNSVAVTLTIMTLSLLVSFLPVQHISKLNPVKALRSH